MWEKSQYFVEFLVFASFFFSCQLKSSNNPHIQSHAHEESKFVANGAPAVVQIVSSAEDLQKVTLRDECLTNVEYLLRLLGLASSHAENDVAIDVAL